jgi:hypothetical protein
MHHGIQPFRRVVKVSDEDFLKSFVRLTGWKALRSCTKCFDSFNVPLKRRHEIVRRVRERFAFKWLDDIGIVDDDELVYE